MKPTQDWRKELEAMKKEQLDKDDPDNYEILPPPRPIY